MPATACCGNTFFKQPGYKGSNSGSVEFKKTCFKRLVNYRNAGVLPCQGEIVVFD